MNLSKIEEEANIMQAELECCIPTDGNGAVEHATRLAVYMARSGQLLAEAKKLMRDKKTAEISNTIIAIAKESCLSAKVQNALIDSIASDEMYIVDWLDRINRTCTHDIDLCRTIVSKEKLELQYLNYQV